VGDPGSARTTNVGSIANENMYGTTENAVNLSGQS
jgi:hypothetical protein